MNTVFISRKGETFDYKGPIQPAVFFRTEFSVKPGLVSATLNATSLGQYYVYMNGKKPDARLFTPGMTEFPSRIQFQTYDVKPLIKEGQNALAAIVGDGYYRGSCGPMGQRGTFGDRLALAVELILEYPDHVETVITDPSWKSSAEGPIVEQDVKLIEHYDARKEIPGWDQTGFDDSQWDTCEEIAYSGTLIPQEGENVICHEVFVPDVLHTPDGSTVLDFKQNMAGMVTFTITGTEGQTVRLIHAETLDENGNFSNANLQMGNFLKAGQEIVYDLKDGTQTYTPWFLICGFRYVKLIDWPEEAVAENFYASAVYSDLKQTGTFTCSNDKINQLVKNVEWSLKGNFVDIPTDCPHRERAGWTGDINIFIECADLLADTRKFISKWLKDVTIAQAEDGGIPAVVPGVFMMNRKSRQMSPGTAGWADCITRIPMRQYLVYGETKDMETCYEAMKKHVEYYVQRAKKNGIRALAAPAKERQYILDTGFQYGEWLEPGASNLVDAMKGFLIPDHQTATAWFFFSAKTLAETAEILGHAEDAAHYSELAEKIRNTYINRFIKKGRLDSKRMCRYVAPLYMGIAQGQLKETLAAQLNDLVVKNQYKIGTGFLSTYQILNVLTDHGYHETAMRMIENEECPGWLYEVDHGATTIWEGWDAIDPKTGKINAKSQNHYSPGAAVSWLWTRVAGIRATGPGYRSIVIEPKPAGSLTYACGTFDSVSGRIVSDWKLQDGQFILQTTIPENVQAQIILPDGTTFQNARSGIYSCKIH